MTRTPPSPGRSRQSLGISIAVGLGILVVGAVLLMLIPSLTSYIGSLPIAGGGWIQQEAGAIQQIIYGGAMVLLMIFRPGGILGKSAGGAK